MKAFGLPPGSRCWPSFSPSDGLLFDYRTSKPPWPLRCYGSLLGYRSLLGIGLLTGLRSLNPVNLAHSLGNPLSKWQVGLEFNFNGVYIQQRLGNLELGFSGVAAGPCPPPTPTCPSSDKARS
jgi:hypothetical protein